MARHPQALDDATRCRAGADRARRPPAVRLAMGLWPPVEAVPLHDAGEALALAGGGYVNELTGREHAGVDLVADRQLPHGVGRHLAQMAQRGQILEMTQLA